MGILRGRVGRVVALLLAAAWAAGCSKKPAAPAEGSGAHPTVSEAQLQGIARTNLDSPAPTSAQLERKRRSEAAVRGLGLPVLAELPVVEDESSVRPRTADEVATRCIATTLTAVKGETNDQKLVDELVTKFSAVTAFSPDERAFISERSPTRDQLLDFSWRYECSHVLLWALGYLSELNPPDKQADVAKEIGILRDKGRAAFIGDARLRPLREILDENDHYYRLNWAAVDLRVKGRPNAKANEEVIVERHRALNWLIRYMNQEWDDVSTDT